MSKTFEKQGLIFKPNGQFEWQKSHAALPTALNIGDEEYRIYYTSRDSGNKTYVSYFDWSPLKPLECHNQASRPVLSPGKFGYFDDHGVQCTSVIWVGDKVFMYYLGWNPGLTQPLFYTSIGLAISEDGGETFVKHSKAPILSRSEVDPWMVSGGTVMSVGKEYFMYYLSGIHFQIEPKIESQYDIKIAKSNNGVDWGVTGDTALPLGDEETNISRMTIHQKPDGSYEAWFPVKERNAAGYKCGFAQSEDGLNWNREDAKAGIELSDSGWDSNSIDKMCVLHHGDKQYMFYNGNSFGRDGIGLAIRE